MDEIDLDNLKREDFIKLAQYVQYLEGEVEKYKSASLVLYTQRNNAEKKVNEVQKNKPIMCNICYKFYNDIEDIEVEEL